jgi:membrane protease YdiL (CAAX protease family)
MVGRLQRFVPERIGLGLSVLLFGLPGLILWAVTSVLVPRLVTRGWEPLAAWFAAGMLFLGPLLAAALVGAWIAQPVPTVAGTLEHLRVRRMTARDWRVAAFALVITLAAMAALQALNTRVWPQLPPHPPFLTVRPLGSGQYYLLALWLPFFAANIIGEELWWRGFIQPRQEPIFRNGTWIVQGLLHGALHFSFGLGVLFILWPVVFSIPWAVQRTRNTSVGMVIHAGVNGPGFLAVTLGLAPV